MTAEERARAWRHGQHAAGVRRDRAVGARDRGASHAVARLLGLQRGASGTRSRHGGGGTRGGRRRAPRRRGAPTRRRRDPRGRAAAPAGLRGDGLARRSICWTLATAPLPPGETAAVEEVEYDAARRPARDVAPRGLPRRALRQPCHRAARGLLARAVQVFAVMDGGEPVAFAQLEREGDAAEITQVYASRRPRRRQRHRADPRSHPRRRRSVRPLDHRRRRGPPEGALRAARLPPGLADDRVHARPPA